MRLESAVYQPEEITLMRSALDAAAADLPPYFQTSSYKAALAERILLQVAKGERDPAALKSMALSEVMAHPLATHDISQARRVV